MKRIVRSILLVISTLAATAVPAASTERPWSAAPWLEDLGQINDALHHLYANRDWLEQDRRVSIDDLVERTANRIRSAGSDRAAQLALDRLIARIADGHVAITWPSPAAAVAKPAVVTGGRAPRVDAVCGVMGFDGSRNSSGLAQRMPEYRAIDANPVLATGIIDIAGTRIGVIRIAEFGPQMAPTLCSEALAALKLGPAAPCDESCQDGILTWTYAQLSRLLEDRSKALRAAGAQVLMIDLTDNGGGSEWAEAAARIISPVPLQSLRMGFVRGDHWTRHWAGLAKDFAATANKTSGPNRAMLMEWSAEAERLRSLAADPCATKGSCPLVAKGSYSTGLVRSAKAGELAGVPLAVTAFNIAQYDYHDSVWTGPLIVLVDDETWSAAEEFAAILQDNRAAIIFGARTGGAGCGHTNGGTPVTLRNSRAVLELPDCVRFRADGSNEVDGVIPDVLTGMRNRDGAAHKISLLRPRLADAVLRAAEQRKSR